MESDELDAFIGGMLDEKQLSGVTDDVRKMLMDDLKNRIIDQINRALIDALPDDKMGDFEVILDNPETTDGDIQQFVESSGIDTKQIVATTLLRFREYYLQSPGS